MPSRRGRKSAAQTPAPKSERIYGSTKNRAGSAKSEKSASKIKFDAKTIVALKGKLKEFKSEHPNKNISLADLKAVYRRGAGAYSSSHRPTITGGVPNSRNAWAMARVNKFLKKAAGEKVKAAYVQDDDLMENGGKIPKYKVGERFITPSGEIEIKSIIKTNYSPSGNLRGIGYKIGNTTIDFDEFESAVKNGIWKKIEKYYAEGGIPEDKFVMAASKFQAKYLEQGGMANSDKIYYYQISSGKFLKGTANFYLNEFTQSDETYDDRLPRTIYLDKSKLFEEKPELNPYQVQSRLKEKIEEFLGVGIKTLDGIAEGIKQDEGGGQIKFSFQEATKYGRDDFNKSSIQRLNDKSFKYEEYQIRISNVKFNGEESYQYDEKNGYKTYFFTAEFLFEQSMSKGGMTDEEKKETYKKWRKLVNMSRTQLEAFYNSEEGKKAGLSASEAASQGIDSGRESARWVMKMKSTPVKDWTPTMWKWAKKQISFISRMSGNKGGLYDEKGNKTRKHLSLLIWGHNPKKHEKGGEIMALKQVSAEQAENRLQRIADKFGVSVKFLRQQLELGIDTEMEHTTDKGIARKIALDHLSESPIYYQVLSQIEGYMTDQKMIDEYYASIYAKGGATTVEYSFTTPTGNPTKLNYIQQILVRTTAFKNWFGDWEKAAKDYINDPEKDWSKHYATVSKVIDPYTLEPLVVYHGSNAEKEFYEFDATAIGQKGRPYAYFADNRDYSLNFTRFSQRGTQGIPLIYNCFLNIRKPFFAVGNEFDQKVEDKDYWLKQIVLRVFTDKKEDPKDSGLMKQYIASVKSQIGEHLAAMPPNFQFWIFMAKDLDKIFKTFLITNGYDGIRYSEELKPNYDPNNPAEFTNAWTIFDAGQIKLADGRNLDFNPMSKDIRLDEGGDTSVTDNVSMSKGEALRANLGIEAAEMDAGGYLVGKQNGRTVKHNDASKGGVFHGKSHSEGGIQGINRATGQPIEVEGYEMQIITEAVSDGSEKDFEGRKMTNREILSYLNVQSGGKSFDSGGVTMPEHYDTGGEVGEPIEYKGGEVILTKKAFSNPKKYNYKGRMMTSRQIASDINSEAGGLSFGEGGTTCGCSYGLGGMTDSYAVDALNYINDLTKRIYGT